MAELVGVEKIRTMLRQTTISDDSDMKVDEETRTQVEDDQHKTPTLSRTVETKRRILNNYVSTTLVLSSQALILGLRSPPRYI